MPEGPSLVIWKEALAKFTGKKVTAAEGTADIPVKELKGKKIIEIRTFGKELLIRFPAFTIRIHFMLFGTCLINERKETPPALRLSFGKQEVNLYTRTIRILHEPLDELYDWSADVLNPNWNAANARKKLRQHPDMLVCDALLNQKIFAGAGNIIKNEVLFRTRIHPATHITALPPAKLRQLVNDVVEYSYQFMEWKKEGVLKRNWQIHTKKTCPRCKIPVHKEYMGITKRRTFFCDSCQQLYKTKKK